MFVVLPSCLSGVSCTCSDNPSFIFVSSLIFFLVSLAKDLPMLMKFFKEPAYGFVDFLYCFSVFQFVNSAFYYFFILIFLSLLCSFFPIFFRKNLKLLL